MKPRKPPPGVIPYLLVGGTVLAAAGVLIEPQRLFRTALDNTCQQIVQPNVTLSRRTLTQFLSIPAGNSKAAVQRLLKEPYCHLSSIEVRQGVMADRDAYPLEFDQTTWLILLYTGDEYAGYTFAFHP